MRLIVADTSPIFYLLSIGQIDLLPRLFGRVFVPDAVYGELCHPTAPAALREWIAECPAWLDIIPVCNGYRCHAIHGNMLRRINSLGLITILKYGAGATSGGSAPKVMIAPATWSLWSQMATVAGIPLALIVAGIYWNQLRLMRRTIEYQQQASLAPALFSTLTTQYLARQFLLAKPPVVDGTPEVNTRVLRHRGMQMWFDDRKQWERLSGLHSKEWPNALAYELSIALTEIGVASALGAIPIDVVLTIISDQVIDDWILCRTWIQQYRHSQDLIHDATAGDFHRRHGEWLALAAAIWMANNYPEYRLLNEFAKPYGGRSGLKRHLLIRSQTDVYVAPSVLKILRGLSIM